MWRVIAVLLLSLLGCRADCEEGEELLGRRLADFPPAQLTITGRPKAYVIRFFTDDCRLCRNTLPLLSRWHRQDSQRGLFVLGVYTPKPDPRRVDQGEFLGHVQRLQIPFATLNDAHWTWLKRWWFQGQERSYTSATLILDSRRRIVAIHPGGEFHEPFEGEEGDHRDCHRQARRLRAVLDRLLAPSLK